MSTNETLDMLKEGVYDLQFKTNRTLDQRIHAQAYSGSTLLDFDFTGYTGASLTVRKKATDNYSILNFDTSDGSIELLANGRFKIIKTADEMSVRDGEYVYDMYLRSADKPKREFLRGNFILLKDVTR